MKRSSRFVALVLGLLCLLTLGSTVADKQPSDAPILPLWEPDWSPHTLARDLLSGNPDVPQSVSAIDVDNDGILEMLALGRDFLHVVEFDAAVASGERVELGDRFGWMGESLQGSALACGDLNGDELADFAIGTAADEVLVFLQEEHAIGVHAKLVWELKPGISFHRMWLLDIDGDGALDLLLPDRYDDESRLRVMWGKNDGSFAAAEVISGIHGRAYSVELGYLEEERGIWVGTRDGVWFAPLSTLQAHVVVEEGGRGFMATGDFNCDGKVDIAVAGALLRIYFAQPQGFALESFALPFSDTQWLELADIDGDRIDDLVIGGGRPAQLSWYRGNGLSFEYAGHYALGHGSMGEVATGGATGDVTGDGIADILVPSTFGRITCLSATKGRRSPQALPGGNVLGTADIDGDGRVELLADSLQHGIMTLKDAGTGYFDRMPLEYADGDGLWLPSAAEGVDLNQDGIEELIGWSSSMAGMTISCLAHGQEGWTRQWSHSATGVVSPLLAVMSSSEAESAEVVFAQEEALVGVHAINHEGSQQTAERDYDWGRSVGPFTTLWLDGEAVVVGFGADDASSRVQILEDGEVREIAVDLPISALSCSAIDIDHDNRDEFAYCGLGAIGVGDSARFVIVVGLLSVNADGTGTLIGHWEIPGLPASAFPFPFSSLSVARGNGRSLRFFIVYSDFETGSSALAELGVVPGASDVHVALSLEGAGPPVVVLQEDREETLLIVTALSGNPPAISVMEVPE